MKFIKCLHSHWSKHYLIGPPESSAWGINTVMVFADALDLICCSEAVLESNDGATMKQ